MLNSKERYRFLELLSQLCSLRLIPLDISLESWEIRPVVSKTLTAWAGSAMYASFVAHVLYKSLTFIHVLLFYRSTTPLYEMLLHGEFAIGAAVLAFWYYVSYIKYPIENAALWRMTLTADAAGGKVQEELYAHNVLPFISALKWF